MRLRSGSRALPRMLRIGFSSSPRLASSSASPLALGLVCVFSSAACLHISNNTSATVPLCRPGQARGVAARAWTAPMPSLLRVAFVNATQGGTTSRRIDHSQRHSRTYFAPDHAIRILVGGYIPPSVERIGETAKGGERIAVAHTSAQNGDLMRDPEMVFELQDASKSDPSRNRGALNIAQ